MIPAPATAVSKEGAFSIGPGTRVVFGSDPKIEQVARYFTDLIARTTDLGLEPLPGGAAQGGRPVISLELSAVEGAPDEEGYSLDVSPQRIVVSARSPRGLFYGAITLWQLLTSGASTADAVAVPALRIEDAPRFAWRGAMLDVARHYMPPEFIKQLIDWMALHKLNTLHWHLTDDQGWRLQIRKYPRLTEVGAWRVPAGAAGKDPVTGQPRRYGGFYTQDEVRDLVRYAADRFVTIVPEIEMPGHAQAAIAAYPHLGTGESGAGAPPVSPDWGIHTYLFNVEEDTFSFLEDVLTEVMALFPGKYIHVGGDEAAKDRWHTSERVQQRMRELGVPDETKLQSYFIRRIERFLSTHGRRLIGWDEILEGGLAANATVMSWRGAAGAVEAVRQGHDVVMAPAPDLYLDYLQSDSADEPPGRPTYVTLERIYSFEPVPPELPASGLPHVLGAQVNLWTEHMRSPERVQHAAFPRLAALAEITWSPRRDWNGFLSRLIPHLDRYRHLGINYADSAFAVRMSAEYAPDASAARVTLSNQAGVGEIRYTLDGQEPSAASALYSQPLRLALPAELGAAVFGGSSQLASPRQWRLDASSRLSKADEELKLCAKKLPLRLEDDAPAEGARAVFHVDIMDPCWIYEAAPLDHVRRIRVSVGQLPYNFQLWKDSSGIVTRPNRTPEGELQVRLDSCTGEPLAELSLMPALASDSLITLEAPLPAREGTHDLCMTFATGSHDPLWVIDRVQLVK